MYRIDQRVEPGKNPSRHQWRITPQLSDVAFFNISLLVDVSVLVRAMRVTHHSPLDKRPTY